MYKVIFYLMLILVSAFALWRGDRDNRVAAIIACAATLMTHLLVRSAVKRYTGLEVGVFVVDLATLAGFLIIALWSARFWPLWVAGLQLITILSHLVKQTHILLIPRAYFVATAFWSYPILAIIALGTWRASQRRLRQTWDSPPPS